MPRSTFVRRACAVAGAVGALGVMVPVAAADTGNVVFLHPDGSGPNHWQAARTYWYGPDAVSPWDQLPFTAVYRGHMSDQLAGTSNGGATTHAFGFKVSGPGSFGKDGNGDADPPTDRFINGLSGYPGSILREAGNSRHPIGIVNDGIIVEPGTGAFLAEVGNRNDYNEIAKQILVGRPNTRDRDPQVILGGGEENFLPEGVQGVHGPGMREDGLNLIELAEDRGYEVIRTRREYERLMTDLARRPNKAPKVLGLFTANDTFNDVNEERLIADGLVDPSIPSTDRRSNLILYGAKPGQPGYNPPTVAEMTELALTVLERKAEKVGKPFMMVVEPESVDNFGNNDNAIGTLTALKRSNDVIEKVLPYTKRDTLLYTAADSDAGGMQLNVIQRNPDGSLPTANSGFINPAQGLPDFSNPFDGLYGRSTQAFEAVPDQFGQRLPFTVAWTGTGDYQGGIVTRAAGVNAELLQTQYAPRFDNIDVYRLAYETLFGRQLSYPDGRLAPTRP